MHYPIKFKVKDIDQYCIEVPDLAGCHCYSESIEKGFIEIKKAIGDHLMILAEYGESIPTPSKIDHLAEISKNITWGVIEIDITPYLGKSHKINVTLPELLIKQIDDRVNKSEQYKSRSGFIAAACLVELKEN